MREAESGEGLILVAQSSRILAQSAHRAGLDACAIDCYADTDTQQYASRCLGLGAGLNDAEWLAAADRLAPKNRQTGLIYGSGIDTRPRLVEALAQGRRLLGNAPAILERVNNPRRFFALLSELGITHPETRFSPPNDLDGWLSKPACGEGGKGVAFPAKKRPAPAQSYYQRHIQGAAFSALFLAGGNKARVIGFNTQWTASHDPAQPFLFAGAVNRAELSEAQRTTIAKAINELSAALGLVGLNSLDFMVEDGEAQVIELNPRPSATMALYDQDFDEGLLKAHIDACQGKLTQQREGRKPVRAFRYIYAPQTILVPQDFRWPTGCADIPHPGTRIEAGQPLCSLIVQGEDRCEAESRLGEGEASLLDSLFLERTP